MESRMSIDVREVAYHVEGARMVGLLVRPTSVGPRGAVLIAHEAPGLSNHTKTVAERLAQLGLVAFAYDYQGDGRVSTDVDEVMSQIAQWTQDPSPVLLRSEAALARLLEEPDVDCARVAAIGYCFGGTAVLDLARTGAPLAAIIGFHPGLAAPRPEGSALIRAPVLMCLGGRDEITPAEHRRIFEDEMTAAGVDWRTLTYGLARHSFTNPDADLLDMPQVRYDPVADQGSWRAMIGFLCETGVLEVESPGDLGIATAAIAKPIRAQSEAHASSRCGQVE
jgi:dienelactone hydrolase